MKVVIAGCKDQYDISLEKAVCAAIESHVIHCVSPTEEDIKELNNKYQHVELPPTLHIIKQSKNKDRFGKFIKRKSKYKGKI